MWGLLVVTLPAHLFHNPPVSGSGCVARSPICPGFPSPPLLSAPPTGLEECFFFISLVVGLLCGSIFCQFWLVFVFKLFLSFFWLCEEAQCVYLRLHLEFSPVAFFLKVPEQFLPFDCESHSSITGLEAPGMVKQYAGVNMKACRRRGWLDR